MFVKLSPSVDIIGTAVTARARVSSARFAHARWRRAGETGGSVWTCINVFYEHTSNDRPYTPPSIQIKERGEKRHVKFITVKPDTIRNKFIPFH